MIFLFLLKVESAGARDQQINLSISIKIYLRSLLYHHHAQEYFFFNWNITSSPLSGNAPDKYDKIIVLIFFSLIAMFDVASCNL